MTKLEHLLQQIDENQLKIQEHGTFDAEILKKINYKIRLDWNYYSNRMEGGTLTRSETRSVMVGNLDVKGKPFKDVAEMNGHDQIVLEVLKMSKGEHRISEKRIKEIHAAIMYEENPALKKEIGKWKSNPNEIINYKNEKIEFATPLDVPAKIHELLNEINANYDLHEKAKQTIHPVILAAEFHLKFVSIHPFYDGNGRMSRILTNILLMSYGFPTIIIKEDVKKGYYQLLADIQAYSGDTKLFYAFIAERIIESQQLILDALEGKEIEELDDIDKEIQLWKQNLTENEEVLEKNNYLISKVYFESIYPLCDLLTSKTELFDDLFTEKTQTVRLDNQEVNIDDFFDVDNFFEIIKSENEKEISAWRSTPMNPFANVYSINEFKFIIYLRGFKKNGINTFDERIEVNFNFRGFAFEMKGYQTEPVYFKKLYSQQISEQERNDYVKTAIKEVFTNIKSQVENSKNRSN